VVGRTLGGKYTLDRLLGQGGMGAVYEGRHAATGRRVAVKVVTGDIARNPKLAQRFELEARAAGTIDSEHVVQVLDVGHDEHGAPFMVMERLAGEDVESLLARTGALAPEAAVTIAVQGLLGLSRAHARGIVHRDVKPGNLFLHAGDGGRITVKLLDFGIAKVTGEVSAGVKLTRTGAILGSPLYMSPEQARTVHRLDQRTDLWSMGVVLYEMLAGRAPHHDIEALGELILAVCSRPVPPLRSVAPWVDPWLAAAVERALVIDPAGRYQSADEMAETLRAFLPGRSNAISAELLVSADRRGMPEAAVHAAMAFGATTPGELLPPSAPVRMQITSAEAAVITPPPPPPRAAPRRSALPFIGAGLALAALTLGAALAIGRFGGGAAPSESQPSESAAGASSARASLMAPSIPTAEPAIKRPIDAVIGVWRSDSGRVYDAVPVGSSVELRVRDPSQLAGQGYEKDEARFILSAIPGDATQLAVQDRVRPLPPERTSYDEARARPTCLVTWTEVDGKPLRARLEGDKLTVEMVLLKADKSSFVLEGSRVVRCSALGRAKVSELKSVLVRQ
jgi:serine/threonine protein kinase